MILVSATIGKSLGDSEQPLLIFSYVCWRTGRHELKNPEQEGVVSLQSSCGFTAIPATELQIQDSFSGDACWEASILGVTELRVELLEFSF